VQMSAGTLMVMRNSVPGDFGYMAASMATYGKSYILPAAQTCRLLLLQSLVGQSGARVILAVKIMK